MQNAVDRDRVSALAGFLFPVFCFLCSIFFAGCRRESSTPVRIDLLAQFADTDSGQDIVRLDLGSAAAATHLGSGWSAPATSPAGESILWSTARKLVVHATIREPADRLLIVRCGTLAPSGTRPQIVAVRVNGRRVALLTVDHEMRERRVTLPAKIQRRGPNEITFGMRMGRGAKRLPVAYDALRIVSPRSESGAVPAATANDLILPAAATVDYFLRVPPVRPVLRFSVKAPEGSKYYGEIYPGCFVAGDVATGGGSIKGEIYVEVDGVIDTSGTHPFVPECAQGLIDVTTGSTTLAALTPTQNLGDLIVSDGGTYDINVGSGESSVIEVSKFIIKPLVEFGEAVGSTVAIHLNGTNTVVINVTGKFAVGSGCAIVVDGGDVEDAIINVVGTGPTVRIAREAYVTTPILAPGRKLVASVNASCSNLIASKLIVKGATISEPMFCP